MWKSIVKFCCVGIIVITVENAVVWPWLGDHYIIDVVLMLILVLAVVKSYTQALGYGLSLALAMDLINPTLFGVYLVSAWVIITLSQLLQTTWLKQPSLLQGAVISGFAAAAGLATYIVMLKIGYVTKLSLLNPSDLFTVIGLMFSWMTLTLGSTVLICLWRQYDQRSV